MKAWVLAMLLGAAGPAAAGPLSDLLMAPGLLADAPEGEVFRYVHNRRLPGQAAGSEPAGAAIGIAPPDTVVDGRAVLSIAPGTGGPVMVLTLGTGGDMKTVAEFPARGPNPMLLFFLENVVRNGVIQTGGSPYYIRNRIRDALVAADLGTDQDGRSVVVLHPFANDPNRARMGDFGALTLTLDYDSADPGRLVELLADTGSGTSGYSETLKLTPEE